MDTSYDFRKIERKWQKRWTDEQIFRATQDDGRPKLYCLEFFPYPSGEGLSVGHCKNYVPADTFCRFKSMNGFNVLHPMGWDAFGLPAENEAIKRGRHPRSMVAEYAANYRRTLNRMGCSYDWAREINSSDPAYYRWTQWFFLMLYKRGLAYRAETPINWCPACHTGLANEEAAEGRCWRCDTAVEKRPLPQWYFRITAYADRLLAGLDGIDWAEGTRQMQREWIGRSEGAVIDFRVAAFDGASSDGTVIPVFTTRPDTLPGATFVVLAPEHALARMLTVPERKDEVERYIRMAQSVTEIDRMSAERPKAGVFTGSYAVHPSRHEPVPIWISDYVLMGYGTGAIMAVPAHDQRDFEFARRHGLPVRMVYREDNGPERSEVMPRAFPEGGTFVQPGPFEGRPQHEETTRAYIEWLEREGLGTRKVQYRLRDWLISRQRYWGAPIPIIHCDGCGEVPVPVEQLPVLLPDVKRYEPSGTGASPLATIEAFVNTPCPACGRAARRETDTMGGFACSSWYFLRFADPHNDRVFAARTLIDRWLPVDVYVGGTEHAVMHLLYARFWTHVMYDAGLVGFKEPFRALRSQGSMLARTPGRRPRRDDQPEGETDSTSVVDWVPLRAEERKRFPEDQVVWRWVRMSKSKGNVVTPDEMADRFGADALRICVMFAAPFGDSIRWSAPRITGAHRFVNRVWRWMRAWMPGFEPAWRQKLGGHKITHDERGARRTMHRTIRKVTDEIEHFRFNTAIAALMEWVNRLHAHWPVQDTCDGKNRRGAETADEVGEGTDCVVVSEAMETLALLLAPFAPYLADELWAWLGKSGSTYRAAWPHADPEAATVERITVVVQVNGKVRDRMTVPAGITDDTLKERALSSERIQAIVGGREIRKAVVVPGKLVNLVLA